MMYQLGNRKEECDQEYYQFVTEPCGMTTLVFSTSKYLVHGKSKKTNARFNQLEDGIGG
jgi:hypothetical protein